MRLELADCLLVTLTCPDPAKWGKKQESGAESVQKALLIRALAYKFPDST